MSQVEGWDDAGVTDWPDLADDELAARLRNRGYDEAAITEIVEGRP